MKYNKNFLKRNIKQIIIFLILLFSVTFKLPFYIEKTGGTINLNDRISVNDDYKFNGSLNMAYVSSADGTIANAIISYFNPHWDIVSKEEENGTSSAKEAEFMGKKASINAFNNAIINAYRSANKDYKIKQKYFYVSYIYEDADTNLKIGDDIKSIDNININSLDDISNYISTLKENTKITIKVINNKKEYNRYAKIIKKDTKNIIGIIVYDNYDLELNPKIKFKYKDEESGPSGGLMLSLAIYSKITGEDLTHNLNIAGTGTIDSNGNIGEIGGVKYKLRGAVKDKMDIFLCPQDNYEEALKEKEKYNYKIKIIKIDNFNQAINILKRLGN